MQWRLRERNALLLEITFAWNTVDGFEGRVRGSHCVVVKRVNTEEIIVAIIFEEEERDLLVCCMTGCSGHFKEKKRWRMESEMKFREYFTVWRDIFHLILKEIKAGGTKIKNNVRNTTPKINYCCLFSQYSCVSRRSRGSDAAAALRSGPCAILMRVPFKTKHDCVIVQKQSWKVTNCTVGRSLYCCEFHIVYP